MYDGAFYGPVGHKMSLMLLRYISLTSLVGEPQQAAGKFHCAAAERVEAGWSLALIQLHSLFSPANSSKHILQELEKLNRRMLGDKKQREEV